MYIVAPILRTFRSALLGNAPLPGDSNIEVQFLNNILRKNKVLDETNSVAQAKVEGLSGNRGLSGAINRVQLTYTNGNAEKKFPATLIVKCSVNNTIDGICKGLELHQYREGVFYAVLGKKLALSPTAYYAWGSSWFGVFVIIMEDIQPHCTGVNFFFGNQIWGIPHPIEHPQEPVHVLRTIFTTAAKLHATYWNDTSLLNIPWLKATNWYQGRGRSSWEIFISFGKQHWEKARKNMGKDNIKWNPKLVSIVDKSYAQCSWEKMQECLRNKKTPFTLTHGDFHASNMLWKNLLQNNSANHVVMIDWSEVGVWEPAADLGQMIISDVKPSLWKNHEKEILTEYWNTLVKHGVSPKDYPYEQFWQEFCVAPVGRWIWLFSILAGYDLPANAVQYFHDQLLSFIESHGDYPSYILKP